MVAAQRLIAGTFLLLLVGCSGAPDGGGGGGGAGGVGDKPGAGGTGKLQVASTSAKGSGTVANHGASEAVISADGRWMVLRSAATNMIDGFSAPRTPQPPFLYLHDCQTGANTLISHTFATNNETSNAMAGDASISDNGQFVAFEGHGSNITPGFPPAGGRPQVYLYNRETNNNTLISFTSIVESDAKADTHLPTPGSAHAPDISNDGRFTAYLSSGKTIAPYQVDARTGSDDVFLYDAKKDRNILVSHVDRKEATCGNGQGCQHPVISGDGKHVAFLSDSTNLLPGRDVNGNGLDLFVFNAETGKVTLISRVHNSPATTCDKNVSNTHPPQISDDGRFIVYESSSTDLIAGLKEPGSLVYMFDQETGKNTLISHAAGKPSTGCLGDAESAVISGDGAWIAYESEANDLVPGMDRDASVRNIYLYDRANKVTHLVSHSAASTTTGGAESAFHPAISRDGAYVAFYSDAPNHVAGQKDDPQGFDVFLYNRKTAGITLVSHQAGDRLKAANESDMNILAKDQPVAGFISHSSGLVKGDNNKSLDAFWFKLD